MDCRTYAHRTCARQTNGLSDKWTLWYILRFILHCYCRKGVHQHSAIVTPTCNNHRGELRFPFDGGRCHPFSGVLLNCCRLGRRSRGNLKPHKGFLHILKGLVSNLFIFSSCVSTLYLGIWCSGVTALSMWYLPYLTLLCLFGNNGL